MVLKWVGISFRLLMIIADRTKQTPFILIQDPDMRKFSIDCEP